MRLGECGEQQLDELAVPHTLLRPIDRHVRRLQARQDQLARAVQIAQGQRTVAPPLGELAARSVSVPRRAS